MEFRIAMNFQAILPTLPFILEGVLVTLKFTFFALICGLPIALLMALAKISKRAWLRNFARFYTSIFRGTPLLVQLGLIFYGLPQIFGYAITPFKAGVLTFALNSVAYTSEIIRAGIVGIDPGQWEAGKMLGLSYGQTLKGIILPQAVRAILPALVNEMVDLLKESALVSTIGEADLLRRAHIVASEKYLYFEPLLVVAISYYALVMLISSGAKILEKRLQHA